ncbi:Phosphocarrier protein kinase/phosphorylase [Caenispirillum salinarum AK4]|uniref:phosphoenolpyruvate--protein phosphotransferase n=1 Tax=Caenispirillum salinarum AK4 TaxID=1238182 RepID=K9H5Q3_9PROT|nr:phosphoenolpyruvate--protein phosphotransferase [Caenispirillum salinarum]EKV32917.1 Phosphocarrier protein kinase/phosphorylase [Caenispirillum salinarum AK4]
MHVRDGSGRKADAIDTTSAPRRLLGRLRDVMAGQGAPQERLDKVVSLIAEGYEAEVCSCYVMRAGEVLELFATHGLLQSAVHNTRLRVGEGLVGEIAAHARPLALADAWSHPAFAYRPETGEELYHSLMGVPILRGGRVVGVLVVQNREERTYTEEAVEILETVAMVLAELLTVAQMVNRQELLPVDGNALLPLRLEGLALNGPVGIGSAVLHQPQVRVGRLVAEDPEPEHVRLKEALNTLRAEVDGMLDDDTVQHAGEAFGDFRDVLETYRMFAEDAGWIGRITEAINSGLTAEAAVQKVHDDTRVRMSHVSDPYIRDRLHDLEDLANRLLAHLVGSEQLSSRGALPDDAILICRNLGPTELLDYDRDKLRGLVMEEGSRTMHAVIIARALGIPVVARVPNVLTKIEPYDPIIIDGDHGQVFIRPGDDVREAFEKSLKARRRKLAEYTALRDEPSVTRDGVKVGLMLNAGLLMDLPNVVETGAEGIGLYRTEVPFMSRGSLPNVEDQAQLYTRIQDACGDRPVVFRTLDVGSDKVLPYWHGQPEDNPALGWRSIRISLDRPAILRSQLRALIRAAAGRELRVMFPMVSEVAELTAARAVLDMELAREEKLHGPEALPSHVKVGTMLEVPALIWQLPQLLKRVDFVSLGSNDLVQFLYATDRGNPKVADRYDVLSPPVLCAVDQIARQCRAAGVPLSICGEMAGRPLEAMAMVALGVRTLSMTAGGIGPVKMMLRSMHVGQVEDYIRALMDLPDHSVREKLRFFAQDHGVVLS